MREILFRGKQIDNGEWAYGWFTKNQYGKCFIVEHVDGHADVLMVNEETVGQYIGSNDKDDKCIFEGDIVHILHGNTIKRVFYPDGCITVGQIIYHNDGFMIRRKDHALMSLPPRHRIVVVGNIHDSPELIEV